MKDFRGQRYIVYGGGVSGRAAAHAIRKHGGRAKIYGDVCGAFRRPAGSGYTAAVISPGIRPTHEIYAYCAQNGIPTLGEAELGLSLARCPAIGVTGTNGKTTVTRLIADMTGGTACGNIGYPVSRAAEKERRVLVCELSSFQLFGAHISPDIAVITNIFTDHIDWHGSADEYRRCKCNIASGMNGGTLVLGSDVTVGALKYLNTKADIVRCSTERAVDGAYIKDGSFMYFGERVCPVDYLRLPGAHNVKNALCAIAAAKAFGSSNRDIMRALSSAELAPHRIAEAGRACGKRWIDDSKGTNVSACLAAVEATAGELCLIVGGRDKALDFGELFCALPPRVVEVIAMGESAQAIRDGAAGSGYTGRLELADGLKDAVKLAADSPAPAVLLSPACASFDEFTDYAERGDRFAAEVEALRKRK